MNKNPATEFVPLDRPPLSPVQQSFVNRVHATETLVPKGNTVVDRFPFVIGTDSLRLAICAADPTLREELTDALREYLADIGLFDRLQNLIETRGVRAKILAKGYTMSIEQHEQAFEQHSTPEVRDAAIKSLRAQARARLDALAHPVNVRTALRAVEHVEADIALFPDYEQLHRKYQVPPPSVLRGGMERAIALLRDAIAKPFDSTWHPDAVTRFSQVFGIDFNAEMNPAPAPSVTAPTSPAPGILRTAAAVAAARVT